MNEIIISITWEGKRRRMLIDDSIIRYLMALPKGAQSAYMSLIDSEIQKIIRGEVDGEE